MPGPLQARGYPISIKIREMDPRYLHTLFLSESGEDLET